MPSVYSTPLWRRIRLRAIQRDSGRCTVSRLLGGSCSPGSPHVHHIHPLGEGGAAFDLDNVATVCARHHPRWEALRRGILGGREPERVRCPHAHRTMEARLLCEARLARRRRRSVPA